MWADPGAEAKADLKISEKKKNGLAIFRRSCKKKNIFKLSLSS